MSPQRYLALTAAALLALMGLAAFNAWAQMDSPTKNGDYTCRYIAAKIARAGTIAAPKLVIISGSNALAGIDAKRLGEGLHTPVFNFGLSASLGPGFQSFEAAKSLKAGDAVLLPYEYLAYDYSTPQDAVIDAVYSCGTDYWRSLDWRQKLFFVLAVKPWRKLDSLLYRRNKAAIAKNAAHALEDTGLYGQGHPIEVPPVNVASHLPLQIHLKEDAPGPRAIEAFIRWCKAHRIAVFATWPNTLYFPQYRSEPVFGEIEAFYRRQGVDVAGTPWDAMFPPDEMADTIYHTNAAGMAVRTERLIALLNGDAAFQAWRASARGHGREAVKRQKAAYGLPKPMQFR